MTVVIIIATMHLKFPLDIHRDCIILDFMRDVNHDGAMFFLIFRFSCSEPFALRERILQDGPDPGHQLLAISDGVG